MSAIEPCRRSLPDVAVDAHPQAAVALEWVGMQGISVPLLLDGDPSRMRAGSARLDAGVNLVRGDARGIHMSRLYALVAGVLPQQPLAPAMLRELLHGFLDSHAELSDCAHVALGFDLLLERGALLSGLSGWKSYPVTLEARLVGAQMQIELGVRVGYSSTCPASAALARQLIRQRFDDDFAGASPTHRAVSEWLDSEQGICATPHGQRSEADVRVRLAETPKLPLAELIDGIESALATPLQTAVKREDEQEFARLNGENLMFCEDAARRIYAALDGDERYTAFRICCAHFESLHPHDAVAVAAKGMPA
jgi:GTP cyclohydrolase I